MSYTLAAPTACPNTYVGIDCVQLIKVKADENDVLRQKNVEVQMLKFGQEVDLDKLEAMSENKGAAALKQKARKVELRQIKELAQIDDQIRAAQVFFLFHM